MRTSKVAEMLSPVVNIHYKRFKLAADGKARSNRELITADLSAKVSQVFNLDLYARRMGQSTDYIKTRTGLHLSDTCWRIRMSERPRTNAEHLHNAETSGFV